MPMDIDEAGYQTIALLDQRAFEDGGISGWGDSVLGPSIFAPLMPATRSLGYEVLGCIAASVSSSPWRSVA